jgi:5-hydroxyisourate hydrolase-like protein (transthyretin family)
MAGSRFDMHDVPFAGAASDQFSIKLAPAAYVAGIVVDEDGVPFPNAEVEACYDDGSAYVKTTQTDAEGRFEIFEYPLQPEGFRTGRVRFEHPQMLRSQIDDIYALDVASRKSLRIVLRRGHDIKGIVTTAGGRPAVRTMIEAVPADGAAQFKSQQTDSDGRFLLQGLPDGEITVRVDAFMLDQKVKRIVRLEGADLEVNLRLAPLVLKDPIKVVSLFGMKLAEVTPELKADYELDEHAKGVLVVDPGEEGERLGMEMPNAGEYFWMVGNQEIRGLAEFVAGLLRVNELAPPKDGWADEGYRGRVRVVYSNRHRSNTQYVTLSPNDVVTLKKVQSELSAATK